MCVLPNALLYYTKSNNMINASPSLPETSLFHSQPSVVINGCINSAKKNPAEGLGWNLRAVWCLASYHNLGGCLFWRSWQRGLCSYRPVFGLSPMCSWTDLGAPWMMCHCQFSVFSAWMESMPAAFPLFEALVAIRTTSLGGLTSTSRILSVVDGSAGSSSSGQLST